MNYQVIMSDPAWHFQNYNDEPGEIFHGKARSRKAQSFYPTMAIDDICALVPPACKDSVLFLWACWPLLPEALRVISAWGFEYKTIAWVWVKLDRIGMGFFHGMGYYTRSNSEPCLLATRGNLPKPAARDVQALIVSPLQEHSRKPDAQYDKIERLYPDMSYLEMFARRKRENWHSWGNEIESDVEIQTISASPNP